VGARPFHSLGNKRYATFTLSWNILLLYAGNYCFSASFLYFVDQVMLDAQGIEGVAFGDLLDGLQELEAAARPALERTTIEEGALVSVMEASAAVRLRYSTPVTCS